MTEGVKLFLNYYSIFVISIITIFMFMKWRLCSELTLAVLIIVLIYLTNINY
ncbi:hypothetical protein K7185_08145 [Clostridium butyricum]|uniref:hypothetical protein n=1 Tax=Clostridium butyricum TaxID=1492 RepID=UPI001CA8F13B|nr:hypothetical protein [Clostridium butyricum]MBZ0312441.1 hypothetical protein [Clostridium butyricum]